MVTICSSCLYSHLTDFTATIFTLYWLHTSNFTLLWLHTKLFAEFTQKWSEVTETTHFATIYGSQTYTFGLQTYIYVSPTFICDVQNTRNIRNFVPFSISWGQGVVFQVLLTSRQGRIDWEQRHKPLHFEISYTYSANPGFSEMASRDNSSFLNQLSGLS